jgi:dienelactone hydrolase
MRKLLTVVTALALLVPTATTANAAPRPPVGTTTYSVGDDLTAVVHYPKKLAGHRYPVVLMSHGLWITCADRKAWDEQDYEKLAAWPCAPGTPAIPSYRGYDYLGKTLAAQGMIVISIDANSVIHLMGQEQDAARASLISRHLAMWQQLSASGRGPLAGKLRAFRGHADLTKVGLMGHSRGGRGTLLEAADVNQKNWPAGVRIKAVVPLAAAEPYSPDDDPDNPEYTPYRITNLPVASFVGAPAATAPSADTSPTSARTTKRRTTSTTCAARTTTSTTPSGRRRAVRSVRTTTPRPTTRLHRATALPTTTRGVPTSS